MEQFVDAILELIRGELKTSKVTHVEYGEVKSVSPLKISIDQKLPLSENMLF